MKAVLTQIFDEARALNLMQRKALLNKIRAAKTKAGLPVGNAFTKTGTKRLNAYA